LDHNEEEAATGESTPRKKKIVKKKSSSVLSRANSVVDLTENIPTIDPLTKLYFTNPIKNRICGHVYDKKAVYDVIKQSHRIR